MSSSVPHSVVLDPSELEGRCAAAVRAAGGSAETAAALADAAVQAELRGKPSLGVAHLLDYLGALRDRRLNGDPHWRVTGDLPAVVTVDADRGAPHVPFSRTLADLAERARVCGVAVLSVHNSFSAGELAHYAVQVAREGMVALVCANSPALMAAYGAGRPVTGTNPLSFALPHPSGPRVFDQASSETAWVSVRDAAARGVDIPPGWAVDEHGEPTVDADAALRGALLPFGGVKGANIALMVEMLAALSGGAFSVDAAPFDRGGSSPALGLFVAAIDPSAFDPGFADRAEAHHRRLHAEHGVDFGRRKSTPAAVRLRSEVYDVLLGACDADRAGCGR